MGQRGAEEGGSAEVCLHLGKDGSGLIVGPRGRTYPGSSVEGYSSALKSVIPFDSGRKRIDFDPTRRCAVNPLAIIACDHVATTCRGEFRECLANPEVVERIRGEWQGSRESALARAEAKPDYVWEDIECWINCPYAEDVVEFAMKDLKSNQAFEKFEVWKDASFAPKLMKALLCGQMRLRRYVRAVEALKDASWGEEVAMFLAEQYELLLPEGVAGFTDPFLLREFRLWKDAPWAAKVLSYLAKEHWFDILYYALMWIEKSAESVTDSILEAIEKNVWRSRMFGNPLWNIAFEAIQHFESWKSAPRAVELMQVFITQLRLLGDRNDYVVLGMIKKLLQDNPQFGDDALRESLRDGHGELSVTAA